MVTSGWQQNREENFPFQVAGVLDRKKVTRERVLVIPNRELERFCAVSGMFSLLSDVFCVD